MATKDGQRPSEGMLVSRTAEGERGGGAQMFSLYSRGERLSHTFFGQINKMQSLGHIEGQSWKEHDCHMAWARVTEEFGQGLTMAQVASI